MTSASLPLRLSGLIGDKERELTNRQAIVEYWDSRGAVELFENMNGKPFEGGTLDMKYIWDEPPPGQ